MIFGYWGFGNLDPENIIDGMRLNRPDGWWALTRPWETGSMAPAGVVLDFAVTLNLMLTDCIYLPCCIIAVEASFSRYLRRGDDSLWAGRVMRACFVTVRVFVATSVESFVALSSFVS